MTIDARGADGATADGDSPATTFVSAQGSADPLVQFGPEFLTERSIKNQHEPYHTVLNRLFRRSSRTDAVLGSLFLFLFDSFKIFH